MICWMILRMIDGREYRMNEEEERFITQTRAHTKIYGLKTIIRPKQLFWLRDIKEKYL